MAKEQTAMKQTTPEDDLYVKLTGHIADIPDDAIVTSSGDILGTWANAREGWHYYLMDGPNKDAVQAEFEARFAPNKWVRAKDIGHSNVHLPREGANSMVVCIPESEYQKREWRKRIATNERHNRLYGINTTPGSETKTEGHTIHRGSSVNESEVRM